MRKQIFFLLKKIAKALGIRRYQRRYGVKRDELKNFFERLEKEQIRYVVLRWFEELPSLNGEGDLDILVDDNDFKKLRKMSSGAKEKKEYILFDIYPVSNQVANYSYYVPEIADRILNGRVKNKNGVWIPNDYDYFHSLAYHALFHKGFSSGMVSKYIPTKSFNKPKHDFTNILKNMAACQNLPIKEFTMEAVDEYLNENNWTPPLDVYFRRSKTNEWAYLRSQDFVLDNWRKQIGKTVFILRDKIIGTIFEEKFKELVLEAGAIIEREEELSDGQAIDFMRKTRGGDWGMLITSQKNAGLVRKVFIVKEELPTDLKLEETPMGIVEYDYVKTIKAKFRAYYRKKVSLQEDYHILHTSDNGIEACHYETVLNEVLSDN